MSKATADLLCQASKDLWVEPRNEMIVAKGKGQIQTYWLALHHIQDDGQLTTPVIKDLASQSDAERESRLVKWVADALVRILKQVHGQRTSNVLRRQGSFDNGGTSRSSTGTTVLDEIREIIHMPPFNGQQSVDPDDVVLDPKVRDQLQQYVAKIASMCK